MADERSLKRAGHYLYADQLEMLREISMETGAPVSELVRRAIDRYVEPARRPATSNPAAGERPIR